MRLSLLAALALAPLAACSTVTEAVKGPELAPVPQTFDEALQAGVDAEIDNIGMYERFLARELPDDIRAAFEHLLTGSRNHLAAFQGGRGGGKNR